jgi:hypothetical protein
MSWYSTYRAFLRSHGLCSGCKGNLDTNGIYCASCSREMSARRRASAVSKVSSGMCARCGKPSRPLKTECRECASDRSDRDWLRYRGVGRRRKTTG